MSASLRVSVTAFACVFASLLAVGAGIGYSNAVIERSFADAFDALDQSSTSPRSAALSFDPAHLHLSGLTAMRPQSSGHGLGLSVGDRMTVATRTGTRVAYEVIEVRAMSESPSPSSPRLMLITAATVDQTPPQTVRFIVDADSDAVRSLAKPHAL